MLRKVEKVRKMRKYYIDNIRWLTVVLVVVYHIIYLFNSIPATKVLEPFSQVQYQDSLIYILHPWFMVLLFIVSGMCSRYYLEQKSVRDFISSRTRKLLVPSTLGLIVFQWLQGYINLTIGGAVDNIPKPAVFFVMLFAGIGVLWYIQLLWLFSMLLVLIRKVEKGRLTDFFDHLKLHPLFFVALGFVVWGAAQFLNAPVVTVYRFGIYGFVFFLGYYLFSQERVTDILVRYVLPLGVVSLGLMVANVLVHFGQNYADKPVVNSPLSVTYAWFVCLFVLGFMKKYGNTKTALTDFMNKQSWGLYVFHYLPLSFCGMLLVKYTNLPVVVIYLLTGLTAFTGAYLLNEIISRIPLLRWCVLGIRQKKGKQDVKR